MNVRRILAAGWLGLAVSGAALSLAQGRPQDNVGRRYPNLDAAQHLTTQAYERLKAAQRANEYDLDGHAQKAEELLDEANREISQAAGTANHEHKGGDRR